MKIEQQKQEFRPVCITLENPDEIDFLRDVLLFVKTEGRGLLPNLVRTESMLNLMAVAEIY